MPGDAAGAAPSGFETVVGLEIHVQVATDTKLFCGCPTRFGAEPNTQVCPVCLGFPGALPVVNREAVRLAVRAGLAFDVTISQTTRFDRKNYFYPDLPKGYQISQFDRPYATGGGIDLDRADGTADRVALTRIHLEEDAGKSIHPEGRSESWIDLNRCGTPLLEIVTEPDIRSGRDAAEVVRTIRDVVRWIGVSDANMEEGSLRCDVNVSLRRPGDRDLGTRTEIKNLNSFVSVERAIESEAARQAAVLEGGGAVVQETRLFDADRGVTAGMREKEEAHDYRYFPEPDLPPLWIPTEVVAAERDRLPEFPRSIRRRYEKVGLSPVESAIIVSTRDHAQYFAELVEAGIAPKEAVNWFQTEVLRELNERGIEIKALAVAPPGLAAIIRAVNEERVSVATGREVFRAAAAGGGDPQELLARRGEQISDESALEGWVEQVLSEHPDAVAKIRDGDAKPMAFLVGQVMQRSRGQANPRRVSEILRARIDAS